MNDNHRNNIIIRSTIKQLENDLRETREPVKRTILIELLRAKKKEQCQMMMKRLANEQEKSLNVLDVIMVRNDRRKLKKERLKSIVVVPDIGYDDEKNQIEILKNKRGSVEDKWETLDNKIPAEYSRMIEEDMMNNRLMERLNSEIDFRLCDEQENEIAKPYDDMNNYDMKIENIDTFAKFDKFDKFDKTPRRN